MKFNHRPPVTPQIDFSCESPYYPAGFSWYSRVRSHSHRSLQLPEEVFSGTKVEDPSFTCIGFVLSMDEEKIRVLIAEDDDGLRSTISAWLGDEGFEVEQATNGLDAIKMVQSSDFDLALIDIKMPGVNGLEVLRFIRKNSTATDSVMMTAMSDISMAVEAMKLGAREYLSKPIDLDQLVPQLRSLISKRDAEDRIRRLQADHTARLLYDLHNPISGIRQSVGYLMKGMAGTVSEHQKELLGYMTSSIDRVITLLNDMMDLTKLEAGRVRLNKGISALSDLVQEVAQEFRFVLQSGKVALDVEPDPDLPAIEFDRQKIQQVLQNLFRNAVRTTPSEGTVKVQVRKIAMVMEEGQQPSEYILVSVFNSGPGIPPDELALLFDRYRGVSGDGAAQKSNLGLIICERIIEAHNGKIWVESLPDKGATFSIVLPIR